MTVKELIAELEKVDDKGLEVLTEGCDCFGEAHSAVIIPDGAGRVVLIRRVGILGDPK